MEFSYNTNGTCSSRITFEIHDGKLSNVRFYGGCNGNLKGISKLVEGMNCEDVIDKLSGIKCGFKNTSCPDQLSIAIKKALSSLY